MRNASCVKYLSIVNSEFRFPKEVSKSNPLFVDQSLPNPSIKISLLCIQMHTKMVNSMVHIRSDRRWRGTISIPQITASFSCHHFYSQPFMGPHKNHSILIQCTGIQWSNDGRESTIGHKMNQFSLRNNRLKFKTAGNSPSILEESIEYIPI